MSQQETDATDPLIGQLVGSYSVVRKLGEGGMGDVYEVVHPGIGKRLALKVLHAEYASRSEIVKRFRAEALAVNQIGHPNIVDILDFSALPDGRPYLLMEYLEGESLAVYLRRTGPLPVADVAELLAPICSAVGAAHDHGITHRDLKPENIQLVPRLNNPRYVKVLDFGIAKLADAGASGGAATQTGVVMGTPTYMSPEQAMGRSKEIDHRTDIYALGVITYQMLTGMVPFSGESFGDLMLAHLQAIPRPVFELCDGIPPAWNDVVQTALAKDREHRFQSMAAFADAARAALEGREIPRVPVPPPAKGNKTVALPAPPAGASSGYGTGAGSHPGTAIVSNTGSHPGTAIVGSYPGSYPGVASSPGVVVAGDSIPPARSRKLLLPIILGIGVAVVTVGALVVFAGGDSAAAVVDAGAATDAATIAAADAHAPPADAARAAGIPPDAPPPPPPPADAAPAHHHHHRPPRPQGSGYISVTVTPWAYVYIDGKKQGSTPGRWKVSAGRHRIRLVNPELGKQKSLAITVAKDATERVSQRW